MGAAAEQPEAGAPRLTAEVNLGDRLFRWMTAAFAAGSIVTLAAMALQMTRASALTLGQFGRGSSPAPSGTPSASCTAVSRTSTGR
jgi:hypothetical protein